MTARCEGLGIPIAGSIKPAFRRFTSMNGWELFFVGIAQFSPPWFFGRKCRCVRPDFSGGRGFRTAASASEAGRAGCRTAGLAVIVGLARGRFKPSVVVDDEGWLTGEEAGQRQLHTGRVRCQSLMAVTCVYLECSSSSAAIISMIRQPFTGLWMRMTTTDSVRRSATACNGRSLRFMRRLGRNCPTRIGPNGLN